MGHLAGRGVAQLGIPGEVPNDGDGVHAATPVLIGAAFPLSTRADLRVWPVAVKRRPKTTRGAFPGVQPRYGPNGLSLATTGPRASAPPGGSLTAFGWAWSRAALTGRGPWHRSSGQRTHGSGGW